MASLPGGRALGQGRHRGLAHRGGLRLPGVPAASMSMSSIRLFGAVAVSALTGGGILLSFLALHGLPGAEGAQDPDEQARPPTPNPPMQVPEQAKESPWSASPTNPRSSDSLVAPLLESPAPPVDTDGLRLRRRSHTRALRGLRGWLRIQGYRPPIQTQRPMITVSCRHARPVRSGLASFPGDPLGFPGQGPSSPSSPGPQELADGSTSESGPLSPN